MRWTNLAGGTMAAALMIYAAPGLSQPTPDAAETAPPAESPAPAPAEIAGLDATGPATADDVATALKAFINAYILEPTPGLELELDGVIEVEEQDGRFVGVIPASVWTMLDQDPDADEIPGSSIVEFGAIEFTLEETDRGWFDTTFTLPEELRAYRIRSRDSEAEEPEQGRVMIATLGGQSSRMLIAPEYLTTMEADIRLQDVTFTVEGEEGAAGFQQIAYQQSSDEVAEGVFDSDALLDFTGFRVEDEDGETFQIARFGIEGRYEAADLAELRDLSDAFSAAAQDFESDDEEDVALMMAEMGRILGETGAILGGFTSNFFLEGLSSTAPDLPIGVGELTFGFDATGLDQDRSAVAMRFILTGAHVDVPLGELESLIPSDTAIRITASDLPNEALLEGFRQVLQAGPDDAETAAPAAAMAIYQAIIDAGSTVSVDEMRITAPETELTVDGNVRPDAEAEFGVVATAHIGLSNMPRLIELVQMLPEGSTMMAALTIIQSLGREETDEEGRPVRLYDVEVTPEGAITLNGSDLAPVIRMVQSR